MTYDEFKQKYIGKGVDFDGSFGFQCVDLAHQYAVEVVGHDFIPVPGAKDIWQQNINGWDKITNTPTGVPLKGDMVIWGTGVGPYGHVGIFDSGDTNSFLSLDENWPINSITHLQNHNYNGVLGWFHPKSSAIQPQPQTQTDQTIIDLGQYGKMEIQAIKGKLGDLEKVNKQLIETQQNLDSVGKQLIECQTKPATVVITSDLSQVSTKDLITALFKKL